MNKKYLVALQSGGLMECPELSYSDYEIIESESEKEAQEIYNDKHKCSFFYGYCIGEVINDSVNVPLKFFKRI